MLIYKLVLIVQTALYCQPDAKIANGVYWFHFWVDLALKVIN